MPQLDYIVLAEHVRQDPSGIIHIMGAGLDTIIAPVVPTAQPVGVALRITFDTTEEVGAPHQLRLVFQGPDNRLFDLTAPFLTPPQPPNVPEHWRTAAGLALGLTLPLPDYGDYSLELDIDDGEITKSIDIRVIRPPAAGPGA